MLIRAFIALSVCAFYSKAIMGGDALIVQPAENRFVPNGIVKFIISEPHDPLKERIGSGVLMGDRIVTTGHFPLNFSFRRIEVTGGFEVPVQDVVGFKTRKDVDIGVIKLRRTYETPIKMPDEKDLWPRSSPPEGALGVFVFGFAKGPLKVLKVERLSQYDSMFVAWDPRQIVSKGDSGGPLIHRYQDHCVLRAVTSETEAFNRIVKFAPVYPQRNWINSEEGWLSAFSNEEQLPSFSLPYGIQKNPQRRCSNFLFEAKPKSN